MENIQRAAIYIRQSQTSEDSISPDIQLKTCKAYIQAQGWTLVEESVHSDIDISGRRTGNRPGLKKLRGDYESGKFDIAVAHSISRFSRTMSDGAEIIGSMPVATVLEGKADTGDDFVPLLHMLLAHKQSREIGKRWGETRQYRVSKGLTPTGHVYFGYDKDGVVYSPNTDAEYIRQAYTDFIGGKTLRKIAGEWKEAGLVSPKKVEWNYRMVRDTLDKKFYIGKVVWDGEEFDGAHEPLISESTWSAYRLRRKQFAGRGERGKTPWELAGILKCKKCGASIGITGRSPNGVRIGCVDRHVKGKSACPDSRSVYKTKADKALVAWAASNWDKAVNALPDKDDDLQGRIDSAQADLLSAQGQLSKFVELSTELGLSVGEMKETLAKRRAAVKEAEGVVEELQAAKGITLQPGEIEDLLEGKKDVDVLEWNAVLRSLIKEAYIDDGGEVIIR